MKPTLVWEHESHNGLGMDALGTVCSGMNATGSTMPRLGIGWAWMSGDRKRSKAVAEVHKNVSVKRIQRVTYVT